MALPVSRRGEGQHSGVGVLIVDPDVRSQGDLPPAESHAPARHGNGGAAAHVPGSGRSESTVGGSDVDPRPISSDERPEDWPPLRRTASVRVRDEKDVPQLVREFAREYADEHGLVADDLRVHLHRVLGKNIIHGGVKYHRFEPDPTGRTARVATPLSEVLQRDLAVAAEEFVATRHGSVEVGA